MWNARHVAWSRFVLQPRASRTEITEIFFLKTEQLFGKNFKLRLQNKQGLGIA